MSSWSKRRKTMYASMIIIVVIGVIGVPLFFYLYKAPTCFDGVLNGDEVGIDCGGSCVRVCQNDFLSPSVAWSRFEEVAPSLYNFATYIINPNLDGEAINVPYHMVVYDANGMTIVDKAGFVTIPPHRNVLAFQGAVPVNKRIPAKVLFEFTGIPDWHKRIDPLKFISISDLNYIEDASASSLTVALNNSDVNPISNISVYAILYDAEKNAVGFSKTIIDEIPASSRSIAPFTWPKSRNGSVISEEILPVAE